MLCQPSSQFSTILAEIKIFCKERQMEEVVCFELLNSNGQLGSCFPLKISQTVCVHQWCAKEECHDKKAKAHCLRGEQEKRGRGRKTSQFSSLQIFTDSDMSELKYKTKQNKIKINSDCMYCTDTASIGPSNYCSSAHIAQLASSYQHQLTESEKS